MQKRKLRGSAWCQESLTTIFESCQFVLKGFSWFSFFITRSRFCRLMIFLARNYTACHTVASRSKNFYWEERQSRCCFMRWELFLLLVILNHKSKDKLWWPKSPKGCISLHFLWIMDFIENAKWVVDIVSDMARWLASIQEAVATW